MEFKATFYGFAVETSTQTSQMLTLYGNTNWHYSLLHFLLLAEQWSIYFIYDLSIFMRILKSRTPQAEE